MGNIKIYLQLISSLHIDMTQGVEILSHVKQELTCPTYSEPMNTHTQMDPWE